MNNKSLRNGIMRRSIGYIIAIMGILFCLVGYLKAAFNFHQRLNLEYLGDDYVKIPIDTNQFHNFVVENKLFEKTRENMVQYLKSWYEDDHCAEYTAFYDNDLNCFDDKMTG
jgi:hypothetical protein